MILKGKAELNLYAKKKELFHKQNWALLSKKVNVIGISSNKKYFLARSYKWEMEVGTSHF